MWNFAVYLYQAGPLLCGFVMIILAVGIAIARLERWSLLDGVYHAFINATTVGYGDYRPTRTAAKLLAILLAFVGLVFAGLIVAIAVHAAGLSFPGLSSSAVQQRAS